MAVTIKQISVLQSNGSYLTKDIGVDAQNVDIDETHTLADKITDWDNKVDKVSGKELSTNDYTNEEKSKLASLNNYDDTALSGRVTNIEDVIPSTASENNKLATIADIPAGGGNSGTTNYSDLTNKPQIAGTELFGNKTLSDLGIQPAEQGKGLSTEDYTTEEKTKLAGLSNYDDSTLAGRVSDLEGVVPSSASAENKLATMADIPTGSSGSGVGTSDYLALDNKPQIAGVTLSGNRTLADLGIQPIEEGKGLSTNDFSNEEKTKLAGLTNYDDTTLVTRVSNVENDLSDKVDKDGNKILSTNDFTNAYKDKLDNLSNYDDTILAGKIADIEELIPTTASEDNKLATMADIPTPSTSGSGTTNYNDLENKPSIAGVALSGNKTLADLGIQPAEQGKGLSTENYTTEEKTKLSSLSNYDDTTLAGRVTNIEDIIPSTANEDNKLATMADISSGSGDTVDYNNLLTLINNDPDQSPYNVEVGETYTLGSGAKTNQNNPIQVKCLSIDNETAIMQTYGVTAESWPGEGDLTEVYSSYFGELSSAISEVKLPTGTNENDIEPSGAYDILKTAASNYNSFRASNSYAWLGTLLINVYVYVVQSNGAINSNGMGNVFVCAPYFTLNLSKILVNDGVIELNPSYQDAEFTDVINKIETKLNNRYTKSEVNSLLGDISSIPEGGTTGQVLAKKSDTDEDVEWIDASNGSTYTFNSSDFTISEQGEVSLNSSDSAIITSEIISQLWESDLINGDNEEY